MNLTRLYSRVFLFICLLGFLLQLQQVSELYFRFTTTSKTEYRIPDVDYYQTVMFCPRSLDLIDRSRYKEYGLLPPVDNINVHHNLRRLTIKDILELTPPESKTIDSCVVRQGKVSEPIVLNSKQCHEFFEVRKSVVGERICYTFMPRVPTNYSVGSVSSSQTHTGYVYRIAVNRIIGQSRYAVFMTANNDHNSPDDFFNSRAYSSTTYNVNRLEKARTAILGESIDIHRLPPPYNTRCTSEYNGETCYEKCLTKKFAAIDRVSWSGFHEEKVNLTMITAADHENQTLSHYIHETFDKCHLECKLKTECFIHFSRTTSQVFNCDSFTIASMLPSLPHMSVYAVPCLNLVEYIVQVGSCFGIWFGLSIISFNPIKWKALKKKGSVSIVNQNRVERLFTISKKTSHE